MGRLGRRIKLQQTCEFWNEKGEPLSAVSRMRFSLYFRFCSRKRHRMNPVKQKVFFCYYRLTKGISGILSWAKEGARLWFWMKRLGITFCGNSSINVCIIAGLIRYGETRFAKYPANELKNIDREIS